ncbi:MAG: helix-turn-helix domain-containing protein [Candidatus Acidiferrales bacterium]
MAVSSNRPQLPQTDDPRPVENVGARSSRAPIYRGDNGARAQRQTQPKSQSRPAEQKINQEEAAERCGLHRTYYSGVERGVRNVSPVNIEKIARAAALGG